MKTEKPATVFNALFMSATLVLALMAFSTTAQASVPPQAINFQTLVTDADDEIVRSKEVDLTFRIFDVAAGGAALWEEAHGMVFVSKRGMVSTRLGSINPLGPDNFDGQRFLEVVVDGDAMDPRVRLVSVPYALRAGKLTSLDGSQGGQITSDVDLVGDIQVQGKVRTDGFFMSRGAVDGHVLTVDATGIANWKATDVSDTYWALTGNAGTTAGTNFLGTTDATPLSIRVNNEKVMRFRPADETVASYYPLSPSISSGYSTNKVEDGINGAIVMGGGSDGNRNYVSQHGGAVFGGSSNSVSGSFGFVAGGYDNSATAGYSAVVAGRFNRASGNDAIVLAGMDNVASGDYSIAAGKNALAQEHRSFVWNGREDGATVKSTTTGQFKIAAPGGVDISGSLDARLDIRNAANTKTIEMEGATGTITANILTLRGGADICERIPVVSSGQNSSYEPQEGDLAVIDSDSPGSLVLCDSEYDSRVAGIISGANGVSAGLELGQDGLNTGEQIAMTGRVYCNATAYNGAIQPGDLLTTSSITGHAMKATDRDRSHGAIVGKAMSALESGEGMVLVLVNLQ